MTVKKALSGLVAAIVEEADRNEPFRTSIERALSIAAVSVPATPPPRKKSGRRAPAVLDPIELARQSEDVLRKQLRPLTLDQLRDIVAEHGMDAGKLVMKWKDAGRVIERIVELSLARATKGDAFRND
ncbi:MAG: hypothetical protein JOY62_08470 [Acidobacteriaceae bacterium]|nr:hypothetical protein [Acidobacteriaceae bacterium]MBV9779995.1 hypothetical protein [Acidobacteriaceae bacterium]